MKYAPLIIFGVGGVGRALLRQIMTGRDAILARNGLQLDVLAVVDSRSWLWSPTGLGDEQLQAALMAKKEKQPVGEDRPDNLDILRQVEAAWVANGIVVDVTATDGMEPVLDYALEHRFGVVLANKKPLAGPWATAQRYFHHPLIRHESTVGGGQPVIATLRYLLDTNDPVMRIEGQMSGTLGFICREMDGGTPFSQALARAKARGYTELDPREDLSGRDVMRKVMILGRMAGWPLEEADINVESLYSPALAHLSVPEFIAAAVAMDPRLQDRVNAAGAAGEVLRYVAELEGGKGQVGLRGVPVESPLASMKYISFHTGRYDEEPLLIGGKGAGVEMTAAGVLGDIIDLGREVLK
jgi:homoserine dehydrogenase